MANTEANRRSRTLSKNKYNDKAYDRLNIQVKKGEREKIKAFAESKGESLNGFINRLVYEAMEKEKEKETKIKETTEKD